MKPIGKIDWIIAGGRIPFLSNGKEPVFISNDRISVLNTTEETAELKLYIFYENDVPVGPYVIKVKPFRVRKIRFNDLIAPEAMELERNFSCYIESNIKVVVQFSRMNTGSNKVAEMSTLAFPVDT